MSGGSTLDRVLNFLSRHLGGHGSLLTNARQAGRGPGMAWDCLLRLLRAEYRSGEWAWHQLPGSQSWEAVKKKRDMS